MNARLNRIAYELATWDAEQLLIMEKYTVGAGHQMIRQELGNRGLDKRGEWVGFDQAYKEWGLE